MTAESASLTCDDCKRSMEFGVNVGVMVLCQDCYDQLQCEAAGEKCGDCKGPKVCAYKRKAFESHLVKKNLLHLIEVR